MQVSCKVTTFRIRYIREQDFPCAHHAGGETDCRDNSEISPELLLLAHAMHILLVVCRNSCMDTIEGAIVDGRASLVD